MVHFTAIIAIAVSLATIGRAFTEAEPYDSIVYSDIECNGHYRAYMPHRGLRRRRHCYPKDPSNNRYRGDDNVSILRRGDRSHPLYDSPSLFPPSSPSPVHIPDPPAKPSSRAEVIEKRKERQRGFSLKSKRLRLEAKKLTQRVDELLIPHKEKWEDLKREHDKLMREHDYWKKQNELSTGLIPPPARISSLQPPASASQPHAGPSNAPNAPHNPPRLPPVRYAEQKVKLKARIKDLERGLDPWEGECQNLKNWNSALLEECERLKEQDLATTEKTIQAGGTPLIASQ